MPYLQVNWWGRSLCLGGPLARCRYSSCRASRGRSVPPHRLRWASPLGGLTQPSGPSPRLPAWTTCPPRSPPKWFWPWSPALWTFCALGEEFIGSAQVAGLQRYPSVWSVASLHLTVPLCPAVSCPQLTLSSSLPCARCSVKRGQITVA